MLADLHAVGFIIPKIYSRCRPYEEAQNYKL